MATSFQPNNVHNNLFAKSKYNSLKFIFVLLLSLSLIIVDYHYSYLKIIRTGLSLLAAPLQLIVDYPVRIFGSISYLFTSKKSLIDENMQLRYQQTMLETHLQKLLIISNENSQLKELLAATSAAEIKAEAAEILAVDTNSSRQLVVVNKGKRNGVFEGQPVLDAKGVMGQIIDVGLMTSTVLLISDSKSAVPVRNDRTGERAILVGTNNISELSLINLPKTSSMAAGDLLVTSGLGRSYPEGYPVGRIETIKNVPGEDFIKVTVSPIALLNRSRLVLLIWLDNEHENITKQINAHLNKKMEDNV